MWMRRLRRANLSSSQKRGSTTRWYNESEITVKKPTARKRHYENLFWIYCQSRTSLVWNANTVTCLPMSIICIRDTIISSTHTFMSGPSMNILTYFPYIRSPLTNILRAYCDIRSVFFIISRAFVDMYSARFTVRCQNFVICGSFSYRLALRSLRLTACGP